MIISDSNLQAQCTQTIPTVLDDNGWALATVSDPAFVTAVQQLVRQRLQQWPNLTEAALPQLIRRTITHIYCKQLYDVYKQDGSDAQAQAMAETFRFVYRRLLALTKGDQALAQHHAQDAVTKAWQTWDRVRDPGSFLGYVERIGINSVLAVLKRATYQIDPPGDESGNDMAARTLRETAPGPEQQYETQALIRRVCQVITSCLPHSQEARIIIDVFIWGKRYIDMAAEWNTTASYLHGLKFRAIRKLRQCEAFTTLRQEWLGVT